MKKQLLFLGILGILFASITPQVNASDRDVGYAFVLPVDNNAVVSTACQAVSNSPGYVINRIAILDTGERPMELRAQSPGLRADEINLSSAPPPCGCFYDIFYNYKTHSFTRLDDLAPSGKGNVRIVSTSNGGSGY